MDEFERVYRAQADPVFRFVLQRVGRRDIAEEITGDVFLALYRHWNRIDVSQLPSWLFAVAKNSTVDYWRKKAREKRYVEEQLADPSPPLQGPSPQDGLFRSRALKPVHRICLTLRYVYGMNRDEISSYTGLSDNQVKSCLQYGVRLLRKEMQGQTESNHRGLK